jgi:hypothetical protein
VKPKISVYGDGVGLWVGPGPGGDFADPRIMPGD